MPFIQFQHRRDTAALWTSNNPTLASGEMGIETDTSLFKIGNGTTPWISLPYGGLKGATGATASVSVGTVTTLAPGSAATVTNSGTSYASVLDFGIPQGATGDTPFYVYFSQITYPNHPPQLADTLSYDNPAWNLIGFFDNDNVSLQNTAKTKKGFGTITALTSTTMSVNITGVGTMTDYSEMHYVMREPPSGFTFSAPTGSVLYYNGSSITGSSFFRFDPASGTTGEVTIEGKLTVIGGIDPLYLNLVPTTVNPFPGITGTLWVNASGELYYDNAEVSVGGGTGGVDLTTLNPIAIGVGAGFTGQQLNAIAIGVSAGYTGQESSTIAIGLQAGITGQKVSAIAIGGEAGALNQQNAAVAIGNQAGQLTQGQNAIAIGNGAGYTGQQSLTVAIGYQAANGFQQTQAVAIGYLAGAAYQQSNAVAIGTQAGFTGQQSNAIAIGPGAGNNSQLSDAIAIGSDAGNTGQGTDAIAIGTNAGKTSQQSSAIAIGNAAGNTGQQADAIAIGYLAGNDSQQANTIAIGVGAGASNQAANTIILNASGVAVNGQVGVTGAVYVTPVRNSASAYALGYNPSTFEVTYDALIASGPTGPTGNGISFMTIDGGGDLNVAYTNGNNYNLGHVVGATGATASVSVGSVMTLAPGSTATVTDSGTSYASILNFGIPQGETGGFTFTGPTDVILYYDGTGVTGTTFTTINSSTIHLETLTVEVYGVNSITVGDGFGAGFECVAGVNRVIGSSGLTVDESLIPKSITDISTSIGSANQLLSAGTTGGSLLWVDLPSGATGESPTSICATARSTASQGFTTDISENIQHDVVDFAYGITATTGPTGYFEVPSAGVYKIIPSLQINPTGNGHLHVWLKVNGTNVDNTGTYLAFKQNEYQVFTTEILLELNANDQVQVWAQPSVTGGVIQYIAAGGTPPNDFPAAPGIITNMYKLRDVPLVPS